MPSKVLFVDDDPHILAAIQRQLRKKYDIHTAEGPKRGLEVVKSKGPFPVVVSDQRMPEMEGVEFLARVRKIAPESIRIMLTGEADIKASIDAVNKGHVFRFLTKPCPAETLIQTIELALDQYRLVRAEKELLRGTLRGSVNVMTEVLSLVNPEAFGRASRIKRSVRGVAKQFEVPDMWRYEMAAMLSQIGCVILPEAALKKYYGGKQLDPEEEQLFNMHPSVGANLLKHIPRLEEVAAMIAYQEKNFDGSGVPADKVAGKDIPLGGRILKVILDYDRLESAGSKTKHAFSAMEKAKGRYDPDVLAALETILGTAARYEELDVTIDELKPGMFLLKEVRTRTGMLVVARGQEVSEALVARLKNFKKNFGIAEPIHVKVP